MSVIRIGDRFILNHGSFSRGAQNVIRFWESTDLIHWKYMGQETDLGPDSRWYNPDSRLDCMDVVPVTADGKTTYYGYATGPGGFLQSDDGLHWSGMPHPVVNWDAVPPPPTPGGEGCLEIGGCQEINGKYYLVGGWFNYMGATGYGVYTLVADSPTGPFRPDHPAFRLCGNSRRWVAMWARFCRTGHGLLVNGYMYSGYTYETGEAWLPLLKKPVVDAGGHLRLGYWDGNEALKGQLLPVNPEQCVQVYPPETRGAPGFSVKAGRLTIEAGPERNSILRLDLSTTVVLLDTAFDLNTGIVLEGTVQATCHNTEMGLVSPAAGFYLEEATGMGTAILLHGHGLTQIGKLSYTNGTMFESEDEIGPGCASVMGIIPHKTCTFRLFVRKNMFELYLDDRLVQAFNTTHSPDEAGKIPRRIGFLAQNGQVIFENLNIWQMSLES
jgi:hypothetical protein